MTATKGALMSNERQSFRTEFNIRAELFYHGDIAPCVIVNMSAGGMMLQAGMTIPEASQVTLGLRLYDDLKQAAGIDYLSFHLEVLEVLEAEGATDSTWLYRCRNLTNEGSPLYERAIKVVFEAERRRLAAESGNDKLSPMATDAKRRAGQRTESVARYKKASIDPLHGK